MIEKIELSGTPKEMGLAFGEQFRDKIQQFAETRMKRTRIFLETYGVVEILDEEILKISKSLLVEHEKYNKDLWEEFCAIASGANISPEKLLICQGYTDVRDYIFKLKGHNDISMRVPGCSAFMQPAAMTKDNGVLCGQTWDMSLEAVDFLLMVHKKPKNGLETLCLTTTGCFSLIGLNSAGIAVGNTNLLPNDAKPGVHYLCTITNALQQKTLVDAKNSIINTNRLSGHSFYLASEQEGCILETTADTYQESPLTFFPLTQTNHYRDEKLREREIYMPQEKYLNSLYRLGRMTANFSSKNSWTMDDCWQAMSDNTENSWRACVCDEDFSGQFKEFATVATIVLNPKERKLWVCAKGALNGEKEEYAL